jgi:hypothetical protein
MPMMMKKLRKPTIIDAKMRESNHAFARRGLYSYEMLFLAAFARIIPPEPEPNAALGHLGLTVIALVFVLLTFWKA